MSYTSASSLLRETIFRLTPSQQVRNPVMFIAYFGAILSTLDWAIRWFYGMDGYGLALAICVTIWSTVLVGACAEAYAEGRGKAHAASLRQSRGAVMAKRLREQGDLHAFETLSSTMLRFGDLVLVEAGDFVPADGQVVQGLASVDESAITGESAPVIREAGTDRDKVTTGTRLLSDWLVVRVTADAGDSTFDQMIALIENAKRKKTPSETSLDIILATVTGIFIVATATLMPFSHYTVSMTGRGEPLSTTFILALLVCLIPTTIGGLLGAIGIAGINRLLQANVIATSGHAVEAAGDVSLVLLDKTGTITHGNREAVAFLPAPNIAPRHLVEAAVLTCLADETPEGRSIVALGKIQYGAKTPNPPGDIPVTAFPFSAETRVSGVTIGDRTIVKGADDAIELYVTQMDGHVPQPVRQDVERIARQGGTPLLVAEVSLKDKARILGVIHLKDIVKNGIKERMLALRHMGITSIMITGDNPLTAAAIAAEAGVDDFIAKSSPEAKLTYIRWRQDEGDMIAMIGDGTNDAPALAQADVAIAMANGAQAAKEASNMIDMDSDPAKLIEIVKIGKQMLITRGALAAFSLAADLAKYFAAIPAILIATVPSMHQLNIMNLATPETALLSALLFNTVMIILTIPLAIHGVRFRPMASDRLLRHNLIIYGGGGLIAPFALIKTIDSLLFYLAMGGTP